MQKDIKSILEEYKNIVVIGLSPKTDRASYGVTSYLIDQGYNITGVRPESGEILNRPVYPSLLDVPGEIEIVDVFRSSEFVPEIVDQAIQKKAKVLWLQEGVTHPEAEERATKAGIAVVSNKCILKEHRKLFS